MFDLPLFHLSFSHQNNFLGKNLLVFYLSRDYLHFQPKVKWNLCFPGKIISVTNKDVAESGVGW